MEFSINFKGMSSDLLCPLCRQENDSQEHALSCETIAHNLTTEEREVNYSDLFGTLEDQLKVVKIFQKVLKIRNLFISEEPTTADRGTSNTGPSG